MTALLTVMAVFQSYRGTLIQKEMVHRYDALGHDLPKRHFEYGRVVTFDSAAVDAFFVFARQGATLSRIWLRALVVLGALGTFLLPLLAQVVVILKLGSDFDWTWRVWLPLGAVLLLSGAAIFGGMSEMARLNPQKVVGRESGSDS